MSNQTHTNTLATAQHRRWRRLEGSHLALALLTWACSGGVVNVGENDDEPVPTGSKCQRSTSVEGSVLVENQEQLDELAGCEAINGALIVRPFSAANLRALSSLRRVEGALELGVVPPPEVVGNQLIEDPELRALVNNGWLESLEGLESLERVGSLLIDGILGDSLQPLAGLRFLGGYLHIAHCPNVESLSGLENIITINELSISCEHVRDISGLQLSEKMKMLHIHGPVDTLDVSGVREIGWLSLSGTALSNLDAFAGLEGLETLTLWGNPELENALGLNGVRSLGEMVVWANPRLSRLPDFDALTGALAISMHVMHNPMLLALPSFSGLFDPFGSINPPWQSFPVQSIWISDNESLQRVVLAEPWRRIAQLNISNNAQLSEIELNGLRMADTLTISDNAALTRVGLPVLTEALSLEVFNNPLLPATTFDGVRSFERPFSDNAAP